MFPIPSYQFRSFLWFSAVVINLKYSSVLFLALENAISRLWPGGLNHGRSVVGSAAHSASWIRNVLCLSGAGDACPEHSQL